MWIARTIAEARTRRQTLGGSVAFVPTMGALHEGHVSLIRAAREMAEHVLVSVFVNPTQFGPEEDFHRYPRPLEQDLSLCASAGVTGVFGPESLEMYPPERFDCRVSVPMLATILEGAVRPGHFDGVCRVVLKLFNILRPDIACFGQKDYQQLQVVRAMVDDLHLPVRVIGLPTVRETDGLAMSSRNVYLRPEDRWRALGLIKALEEARLLVEESGETAPAVVEQAMRQTLTAHQIEVDYAAIRHPRTLEPVDCIEPNLTGGVVALVAGHLDQVRLLDNMLLGNHPSTG